MSATIAIFFKLPVTGFPFQSPKDHIIAKKKKNYSAFSEKWID